MRRLVIAAALACAPSASLALPPAATIMEAWDTNGDGVLTKDEWLAAEHPLKEFRYSDTNHDGKVTLAELKVALKKAKISGMRTKR
ncbi:MAG TPA: EF-hand domain-containing protein [Caulobacteraceae bacterium]|nr:EF-hand domain-containing protein [Caulobacteraceae bacterium]